MNNVIVIYKSKHGTTKQYAEWIAEDLGVSTLAGLCRHIRRQG